MMVNVGIYFTLRRRPGYLFSLFCVIAALLYGAVRIPEVNKLPDKAGKIRISILQGNIPQELKWNKEADQFIFERYLSLNDAVSKDSPGLIIWPEASLPVILEEDPEYFAAVKELAKKNNTSLLIGAVTLRGNDYYNSAILVSNKGLQLERYDKIHLVPFGEYIPLKKIFPFLATVVPIGDIAAGKDYTIFTLGKNKFSVLICFEDLFPELSREFRRRGAEFLVNITNDGWYKYSTAPYQHLQASVFRAVENRLPLARSANTGISAFIYPDGRIISRIKDSKGKDIFVTGFDTKEINVLPTKQTFYTRFGDIFILACLVVLLCSMISLFFRKD
jgi:apolipoprotein N-acyltransferase